MTDASVSPDAPAEATPSSTASPLPSSTQPEEALISSQGIGEAELGMTLAELKQRLSEETEFTVESSFIVDFDAIAVRQNGEVQYYILYLAGEPFTDSDVIQGLLTNNSRYQTEQGVGPGTLLSEAEQAYGDATLSYNTQNESREYVRFERQPAPNISFGTGNATQSTVGIYPSPTSEYNETKEYSEESTIQSVLVVCLAEGCGTP